jgi:very-short-patch-repair endonuclease
MIRNVGRHAIEFARALRRNLTPSEKLLWERLRHRQLARHRFRRQHPIGPVIVDFCCLSRKLVIEVDGPIHRERRRQDFQRDLMLKRRGYRILRFTNRQVETQMNEVLSAIEAALLVGPTPRGREN